jgi:hypothetical protein
VPAKFYTISEKHVQSKFKYQEPRKLDTYGSERSWEPVESVMTIRGDCRVKTEACTDNARSRTGNTDNMATGRKEHLLAVDVLLDGPWTSVGAALYFYRSKLLNCTNVT